MMNDPIRLPVTSSPALVREQTVRVVDDLRVITTSERALWMTRRKTLLEELSAVETFLEMPRSRMSNKDLRTLCDHVADVLVRESAYASNLTRSESDRLRERFREIVNREIGENR